MSASFILSKKKDVQAFQRKAENLAFDVSHEMIKAAVKKIGNANFTASVLNEMVQLLKSSVISGEQRRLESAKLKINDLYRLEIVLDRGAIETVRKAFTTVKSEMHELQLMLDGDALAKSVGQTAPQGMNDRDTFIKNEVNRVIHQRVCERAEKWLDRMSDMSVKFDPITEDDPVDDPIPNIPPTPNEETNDSKISARRSSEEQIEKKLVSALTAIGSCAAMRPSEREELCRRIAGALGCLNIVVTPETVSKARKAKENDKTKALSDPPPIKPVEKVHCTPTIPNPKNQAKREAFLLMKKESEKEGKKLPETHPLVVAYNVAAAECLAWMEKNDPVAFRQHLSDKKKP